MCARPFEFRVCVWVDGWVDPKYADGKNGKRLSFLSQEEQQALETFKQQLMATEISVPKLTTPSCVPAVQKKQDSLPTTLRNVCESDLRCLQFLRARNFVVSEALAFYTEDRIWREQQAVDGILQEKIDQEEVIAMYWPVWCVLIVFDAILF